MRTKTRPSSIRPTPCLFSVAGTPSKTDVWIRRRAGGGIQDTGGNRIGSEPMRPADDGREPLQEAVRAHRQVVPPRRPVAEATTPPIRPSQPAYLPMIHIPPIP